MNFYDNSTHTKMRNDAREHIRHAFGVGQFDDKFVKMVAKVLI